MTARHPCACTCCRIFQYELNQKLAADGLSAQVDVEASDLVSAGRRRRRLTQAAGTSQLKYTIVVMVPVGKDAAEVGCAGGRAAEVSTSCGTNHWTPADHAPPRCAGFTTTPPLPAPLHQVAEIAKAAVKAVATDRAILRRLLQQCLPDYLLSSLDIEALIDAMIASTVIEVDVMDPSGQTPPGAGAKTPPGAGAKTPPGAAGPTVSLKVTQTIPGVTAAQVSVPRPIPRCRSSCKGCAAIAPSHLALLTGWRPAQQMRRRQLLEPP